MTPIELDAEMVREITEKYCERLREALDTIGQDKRYELCIS